MTFQDLGLMPLIVSALRGQGYEKPTPIQLGAIPPALAGQDVLGIAQTGTGKTCAFATPILQRLAQQRAAGPRVIRALALTPTRELALQIQESFFAYGKGLPLRSAVIFGGVGQQPQVDAIKRGLDILVATPGRLLDLHGQGLLDLSKVEIFVLDEADRMLDMGFIHDVRRVLKLLPQRKQTLFFSATMPPEVTELVNALLHDPARVAVDPVSSPVDVIEQSLYYVDKANKTELLASLLERDEVRSALVFTRTKHGANKVVADLTKRAIPAAAIHGNKSQTARQKALADFKAGHVGVLVATDIAARGLDIDELSHVFNYNLPDVPETYVHRIGRTGRAGHGGTAVSFCEYGETSELKAIEKLLGRIIPVVEDHDWPMRVFVVAPKETRGAGNPRAKQKTAYGNPPVKQRAAKAPQAKQAAPAPKKAVPAPPVKQAPPPSEPGSASRKRRRGGGQAPQAASAPQSVPTPVEQPRTDGGLPRVDLSRAFRGDKLLDATSRMLSSRTPPPPSVTEGTPRAKKPAPAAPPRTGKQNPPPGRKNTPQGKQGQPPRRNWRGPAPVELRPSSQKDSTEQYSLMRPYYLNNDKK